MPNGPCAACNRPTLPAMFETVGEPYDEESEIKALFEQPIHYWEDGDIIAIVDYMRESPHLNLPNCWPADY